MSQKPFLPITLLNRHDGWTPEKQWAFVEALARTASVTLAVKSVGMSAKSAYRLRQLPDAGEFRAAWDAALQLSWGQIEQVALDRVINGERETIERNGYVVAERHKPCSDKLLIRMLAVRERARAAERAERIAEHKQALAEARRAAIVAEAEIERWRRRGRKAAGAPQPGAPPAPPAPPPLPVMPDDAATETAALQAFNDFAERFDHWPDLDPSAAECRQWEADALVADGFGGTAPPVDAADTAAREAAVSIEFASRPRWEDHVGGGKAAR